MNNQTSLTKVPSSSTGRLLRTTVIIVAHNSKVWLERLVPILETEVPRVNEVVIVDNGSSDNLDAWISAKFPGLRYVRQANLGFGSGCNRGAQIATGDILVFLNPDTKPEPGWLGHLVEGLEPGRIHTSQILEWDGKHIQTLGLDLHYTGIATLRKQGHLPIHGPPFEVPGFSGAAFAMLRSDFARLGGFDEAYFLYMEDVDLAWRARMGGFTIWGIPSSRILHRSAGLLTQAKLAHLGVGRARLLKKHLPRSVRGLLFPALAMIRLLEAAARLKVGGPAPAPLNVSPGKHQLRGRPRWLRLTIPFRSASGRFVGIALSIVVNPLLVANGLLWRRA